MPKDAPFHGAGAAEPQDAGPEPTLAERARSLVELGGSSTLSTLSAKHDGYPFGSLMPYGIDDGGSPLFLISSMAMHTRNLQRDPRCTLLIVQAAGDGEALGAGRISIMGEAHVVGQDQQERLSACYLKRNPNAQNWINYGDFALYRLEVLEVYFVGGFGIMGWLSSTEYREANPDPLTHEAATILAHMNQDHVDAMLVIAEYLGVGSPTSAIMTGIDYLGFNLRLATEEGYKSLRVPFQSPVDSAAESRSAIIEWVKQARSSGELS